MLFTGFRIQNFRSVRDSGWLDLAPITVLIGANNSGKSSLLAPLLMLKQSIEDKDPTVGLVTSGPLCDLGSYLDIVPTAGSHEPLGLAFALDRKAPPYGLRQFFATGEKKPSWYNKLSLDFTYGKDTNEVMLVSFKLEDTEQGRALSGHRTGADWELAGIPDEVKAHLRVSTLHFLPTLLHHGSKPSDDKVAQTVITEEMHSILRVQDLAYRLSHLLYVGPVRERIPRYGVLGTMPFSELGPSGQNLMRVLSSSKTLPRSKRHVLSILNEWLDKHFHLLEKVRLKNLDRGGTVRALVGCDPATKRVVNLAATGSGISQIVPVVVQTALTPAHGCLVVEQPEVHLHPAAQTALADLFLAHTSQERQFIIETHSEHLLLRLRRRVAEGKVDPSQIAVFYVEKVEGWTKARRIEIGGNGQFKEWPEGFFAEGYDEALALAKAATKRGRNAK